MRCGSFYLGCATLWTVINLQGCGGNRFAPSTLRQYLREVVTEALDQHYADLNARLDRIEMAIERLGESGGVIQRRRSVGSQRVVVCNVASWAYFRTGNGKFTVDDVDVRPCTHIVYQYVGIDETSSGLRSLNPSLDLGIFGNPSSGNYAKFVRLKKSKPSLKTIISVGGYLEGSKKFSDMAQDPAKRAKFVTSAAEFLRQHGFDGMDLSWQHPTQRGGSSHDRDNFPLLLEELRAAFRPHGWLLTASLSALAPIVNAGYDLPRLSAVLDLFHLQAFDYHGVWDRQTGHNAPLNRVSGSASHYLQQGADPAKMVLGIPLYGSSYLLVDPARSGVGEPTAETAFQGPYTHLDGSVGFNEMCEMRTATGASGLWTMHWDNAAEVPYFVQGSRWVSIEDDRSVVHKVALAKRLRLAGVALTSLDTDDFRGTCGQKNKLMTTITQELHN